MELGFIGLGRMGLNMVARLLLAKRHRIIVWNRGSEPVKKAVEKGAVAAASIEELVKGLKKPRKVWVMLPSGQITDDHISALIPLLDKGDCVIEGGNSNYKDSIRRAAELAKHGIGFMDCGTSGGIWGLEKGYCLMVGGDKKLAEEMEPVFTDLAAKGGYLHAGPVGAGHFTKMVHNGIEYGMMQAYAEGFALLEASGFGLDLGKVASLWNNGSVVRSWLLELAEDVLKENPRLDGIKGFVEDSGEGRWTVMEAIEKGVACPVITESLFYRFSSRQEDAYQAKLLAALRKGFGGHAIKKG